MLRLLIIVIVIVVALFRGGSLRNFAALRLRWPVLAIGGFALQLLIFTPFMKSPLVAYATVPLYLFSLALLVIWVGLNWRIPGMALIAAGLLMNLAAIAANGGHMPVSVEAARISGRYEELTTDNPATSKHAPAGEAVRLWLLTDIIPLPEWMPIAGVLSIGDIVLTLGIANLCYRTIRASPASALGTGEPAAALSDSS
jgi:hypothetical protein